ncbi:hypothetical protein FOZ63_028015 [Perkinsus olseni]|uniref:Uncharacterized protein n=1 Tax=Perkinsus olseni TaxID=32597 RepID=A0A7J6UL93_PEROL|nr:hypothetical protein FOZ62_026293 [Perkinsus olseni]KAF4758060.1 hypothetical protein FOZ63_028015 [Perkinsus olseni]
MSVFSSKVAGAAAAVSPISSSMSPAAARSNEDYIAGARVEEDGDDDADHQQKQLSSGDKAKKSTASCSGTVLYRLYVTFIMVYLDI